MDAAAASAVPGAGPSVTCDSCGRVLDQHVYEVRVQSGTVARCLTCALKFRRLMWRSLRVAAVVGTLLVAINHGNVIIGGDFPSSLGWKIPLTYTVPYCVATFGAIMNARRAITRG